MCVRVCVCRRMQEEFSSIEKNWIELHCFDCWTGQDGAQNSTSLNSHECALCVWVRTQHFHPSSSVSVSTSRPFFEWALKGISLCLPKYLFPVITKSLKNSNTSATGGVTAATISSGVLPTPETTTTKNWIYICKQLLCIASGAMAKQMLTLFTIHGRLCNQRIKQDCQMVAATQRLGIAVAVIAMEWQQMQWTHELTFTLHIAMLASVHCLLTM